MRVSRVMNRDDFDAMMRALHERPVANISTGEGPEEEGFWESIEIRLRPRGLVRISAIGYRDSSRPSEHGASLYYDWDPDHDTVGFLDMIGAS